MKKRFLIILLLCSAHFIRPMKEAPSPGEGWIKITEDVVIKRTETNTLYIEADGVSTAIILHKDNKHFQYVLPPQQLPKPPASTPAQADNEGSRLLATLGGAAYKSSLFVPFIQTIATEATHWAMVSTETHKKLPQCTNPRVVNAMSVAGLVSAIRTIPTDDGFLKALPLKGAATQRVVFALETSAKAGAAEYLTEGTFKIVNNIAKKWGYGDILNPNNPLTHVVVGTAMNWSVNSAYSTVCSAVKK